MTKCPCGGTDEMCPCQNRRPAPDAVARLVEAAPISIDPCKMCGEGVHDAGVILTVETLIDPSNAEAYHAIGYTVRCCACGASVSNEYRDDAVSLWNGEPSALRALKGDA